MRRRRLILSGEGDDALMQVAGIGLDPPLVLLAALELIETPGPVGVAVVEGRAPHVADRDEAAKSDRVSESPGREHEEKSDKAGGGQVGPDSDRVAAAGDRRGEEGNKSERGGARERRESEKSPR